MSTSHTLTIDGQTVTAAPGDTVLEAAARVGIHIPTLCNDPRLDPTAACRMCLVEVSGQRRLQPACAWRAEPGVEITTSNPRIERHRSVLLSMYLADHPLGEDGLPAARATGSALRDHAVDHQTALLDLPPIDQKRASRPEVNPYIGFDAESCIVCARCTRYCDEVEAVSAIQLTGRGGDTTIGTVGMVDLLDTSCELCGGCIATCPTGALFEIKSPQDALPASEEALVRSTCNFCGVGCQVDLRVRGDKVVAVEAPPPGTTVNDGNLCVKGRFAYDFIHHQDRLTVPLIRQPDGTLQEASWPAAIQAVARGLTGVRDAHGSDALGFISSSRCTGEENYLMQKLARAAFGTNNCHQCAAT
jgi:predicted molibdopterin-dependent oxidoreductase YjgC